MATSKNIQKLYRNEMGADVEFVFPCQPGGERTSVPAHKAILAATSPVFERMFYGDLKEGATVEIVDATFEAFCEFLQFFYKDKIDLTEENIVEVFRMVDKYDPQDCHQVCDIFLRDTVTTDLVCLYYEVALAFDYSIGLIKHFEKMISEDAYKIFQTDSFRKCSQIVLRKILEMDHLVCSEIEVLRAAKNWAKETCEINNLEASSANMKSKLGDCFALIRFPIMTADQLTRCCEIYPNFLENNEFSDVLQYILNKREMTTAKHFSTVLRGSTDIDAFLYNRNEGIRFIFEYAPNIDDRESIFSIRIGEGFGILLTYYEIAVVADVPRELCCIYVNGNKHEIHKLRDPIEITPISDAKYNFYCVHLKKPVLIEPNKQYKLKMMLDMPVLDHITALDVKNSKIGGVNFSIIGERNRFVTRMHFERENKNNNGFLTNFFSKWL